MSVAALDATKTPTAVTYPISVVLTLSAGQAYADSACSTSGSTLVIQTGASSASFYYRNSTAQAIQITAVDNILQLYAQAKTTMYVTSAGASRLVVSGFPETLNAGVAASVKVTAMDPYGNQASGYTGTITLSSSAVSFSAPAAYTYVSADKGIKTFTGELTLYSSGAQTVIATDTTTSTVTGSQTGITIYELSASTTWSSLTGTSPVYADGSSTSSISIYVKDVYGNGVTAVTPTFTATQHANNTYGTCSATSASGLSTCTLATTVGGTRVLTLTSPVSVSSQNVTFTQVKITPASSVASPISIGSVAINTATTITVTNPGSTSITGLATSLSGASYSITADTCAGATLAAAATCTVEVTFNAGAGGTASGTHTASLTVNDGSAAGVDVARFTGTKP